VDAILFYSWGAEGWVKLFYMYSKVIHYTSFALVVKTGLQKMF